MPTYFHFHSNNTNFDEQLDTDQCNYSPNNKRCKNRVCIGLNYYWLHTRKILHLKVTDSIIHKAGVGLFAFNSKQNDNAIIFKSGDKICDYNGEIIDEEEKERRYGNKTGVYTLQINNNGRYEDGAIHRGIWTLLNSPSGTQHKVNCRFSIGKDKKAHIVATKNIRNNEELFISYGRSYKFNESNVNTSTNHKKYFV